MSDESWKFFGYTAEYENMSRNYYKSVYTQKIILDTQLFKAKHKIL